MSVISWRTALSDADQQRVKAVVDAGRVDLLRRIDARRAFEEDELIEVTGDPIDEDDLYD